MLLLLQGYGVVVPPSGVAFNFQKTTVVFEAAHKVQFEAAHEVEFEEPHKVSIQ